MSFAPCVAALVISACIFPSLAGPLEDGVDAANRKDYPSAIRLLEPLARSGNALAQLRIGLLHYHGHGVRESDAMALQWFERAARHQMAMELGALGHGHALELVGFVERVEVT